MSRAPYRKADAVRADLIRATRELLAEQPARTVTVRAIAERAHVQHSLITRHFGSKTALMAIAVGEVADDYAEAVAAADDVATSYTEALRHLRRTPAAGMVLTTDDEHRRGDGPAARFPGLNLHLQALLAAGAPDDLRTRVLAGLLESTVIGWSIGRDTVLDALEIPPDRIDEVDRMAEGLLASIVVSQLPPSPDPCEGEA